MEIGQNTILRASNSICQDSGERIEQLGVACKLEKLYDQRDVNNDSEYAVYTLYFFRLFHYLTDLALFHHWRRQRVMISCLVAGFR